MKEEGIKWEGGGTWGAAQHWKQESNKVTSQSYSSVLPFLSGGDRSGPGVWAPGLTMGSILQSLCAGGPGRGEFISAR